MTGTARTLRGSRGLVAVCCVGMFLGSMNTAILAVALPRLQFGLAASDSQVQWVVDGYQVLAGSMLLTAGALGDRYGHRRVYLTGLAVFGLAATGCAAAGSPAALIAFRAVQGAGGAVLTPGTLALIVRHVPDPAARSRAVGIWTSAMGVGIVAGPLGGGLLVEEFGWRAVFVLSALIALIALPLTASTVGADRPPARHRPPDVVGQALAALTLAGLIEAIIVLPNSLGVAGLAAAAAVVLGVAFVLVEQRRPYPAVDLALVSRSGFAVPLLLAGTLFLALNGFTYYNALYLQRVHGFSPAMTGAWMLFTAIPLLVIAAVSGWCYLRFGPRRTVTTGCLLLAGGLLLLAFTLDASSWAPRIAAYVLVGTGVGLANGSITSAGLRDVPAHCGGVAAGMLATARMAGGALSIAVIGSIVVARLAAELTRWLGAHPVGPGAEEALWQSARSGVVFSTAPAGAGAAMAVGFQQGLAVALGCCAGALALMALLTARQLPERARSEPRRDGEGP